MILILPKAISTIDGFKYHCGVFRVLLVVLSALIKPPMHHPRNLCIIDTLDSKVAIIYTWDNRVKRFMYRPIFEADLSLDPQDDHLVAHRFYSAFLVNALLALDCESTPGPKIDSLF